MKKVLITGINSYIGTSLDKWLQKYPNKYIVDTISMRDSKWKDYDFSQYDVLFHVAGIAHVSSDPKMEDLYFKVNRDLTIETGNKAKAEGVKQFIFMSSIIVYGDSLSNKGEININTIPKPCNDYGRSKLEAEQGIKDLEDDQFKIVTLRPPMIYGKNSKGNYPKLAKAAQKCPCFPDINNRRSMLHIDNLCEFIRLIIDNKDSGIFFPQNAEYVKTADMAKVIAEVHGKKIRFVRIFNPLISLLEPKISLISKLFGNLVYEKSMSEYRDKYQIRDFRESIKLTEL